MKKYLIIIFMLSAAYSNAQHTTSFWGINYQAVALNTEGVELAGADLKNVPVSQKNISIRFSILKDSETGVLVYREQHVAKTDDYGLFNVIIGQGKEDNTPVRFDKINWASGSHFLKVEIDIKGGSEFKEFGVQRLWAVPYALSSSYADLAGNGIDSVFDNGDGSVTFKYRSGTTYKTPVLKGLAGPQGPVGPAGPQGIAGADGKAVLNGTNNPSATTGNLGDFYINTINNTLFGPKTGSGWGTGTSLVGPQGPQGLTGAQGPQGIQGLTGATGPQGAQGIQGPQGIAGADGKAVLNGTNNPLATTGNLGDFYINTTNNTLFGPKTGSGWGTGTSLVGPQGPQGLTGAQGPQGIQGLTGATGPQGAQGIQGLQGIAGADGKAVLNGTSNPLATTGNIGDFYINTTNNTLFGPKTVSSWGTGISLVGPQGPQGLTGAQGPQGIQGLTGATGPQGAQGIQGLQGIAGADGKAVLNGTNNPSTTTGNLGDFYINRTNNTLFGPKSGTGWGTGISLVGPQGFSGFNTLIKSFTEPSGNNCRTGGTRLEFGIDSNRNEILDLQEVISPLTRYICNGDSGLQGVSITNANIINDSLRLSYSNGLTSNAGRIIKDISQGSFGTFYSSVTQTAISTTSKQLLNLNNTISANEIFLSTNGNSIKFNKAGTYNISITLNYKTGNNERINFDFWLAKNMISLPWSNRKVDIDLQDANPSSAPVNLNDLHYQVTVNANDSIQLYILFGSGSASIQAVSSVGSPSALERPGTPSVSVNIHQVMNVQAGPQGPAGSVTGNYIAGNGIKISNNVISIDSGQTISQPSVRIIRKPNNLTISNGQGFVIDNDTSFKFYIQPNEILEIELVLFLQPIYINQDCNVYYKSDLQFQVPVGCQVSTGIVSRFEGLNSTIEYPGNTLLGGSSIPLTDFRGCNAGTSSPRMALIKGVFINDSIGSNVTIRYSISSFYSLVNNLQILKNSYIKVTKIN